MQLRTDLALELKDDCKDSRGIQSSERKMGDATITEIRIVNSVGEKAIGKPMGRYVTVSLPPFKDNAELSEDSFDALTEALASFLPKEGTILVAGLGNDEITPDALGPKTAARILATRHIGSQLAEAIGIPGLRSVGVIVPGVLGKTGIETSELIAGAVSAAKPAALVVIDALASRSLERLGCTVQICDSGIHPGAGVGNRRAEISQKTLGIPVIAIGVPTVVDAATLVCELTNYSADSIKPRGEQMMVTPKEIDLMCTRAAKFIGICLNRAMQPALSEQDILSLLDV